MYLSDIAYYFVALSDLVLYGLLMSSFILKIPATRRGEAYPEPYGTLALLHSELCRNPCVTDKEYQDDFIGLSGACWPEQFTLALSQNHGIREKRVSARTKESFKKVMPKIIEMFPGMTNPFKGDVEFHSVRQHLAEVHFSTKP